MPIHVLRERVPELRDGVNTYRDHHLAQGTESTSQEGSVGAHLHPANAEAAMAQWQV